MMLYQVLENCPFAIAHVAPDGQFLAASPGFPKLVGMEMDEFLTKRWQDITHPEDIAPDAANHKALVAGEIGTYNMIKRYRHAKGHWVWVLLEVGVERSTGNAWAYATDISHEKERVRRAGLYNAINHAFLNDEFSLHYQPIVELKTGETIAFEALIRWQRSGELVKPDDWLPFLDGTTFPAVCLWVMGQACRDRKEWKGPQAFAINTSPISLGVPGFAKELLAIPKFEGIEDRSKIWLEITEQAILSAPVVPLISQIYDAGCKPVLDDFGSGYNNLSSLIRYGMHVVKIDKSIIEELPERGASQVVSMVTSLAKHLNYRVVAEGVEDQETADIIERLGVDLGQGYFYGKPAPLEYWENMELPLIPEGWHDVGI